eukprot:c5108_g1_i3.p1 GENE.c5108_g1_i3~~c5108_g1_i3.p1  ORF type:complete len:506 (+),score=106.50 c5108_g1_i3:200-1717(+)
MDDLDAIEYPNRRKTKPINANHLLNFSREAPLQPAQSSPRKIMTTPRFSKDAFVQANCRFIVNRNGDYRMNLSFPDHLVEWSLIDQVCIPSHHETTCPICLSPLIASKVTRCGHVFCFPCLIQYLSMESSSLAKCPICPEYVSLDSLKSVYFHFVHSYTPGSQITFKLLKRHKGNVIAVPVDQPLPSSTQPPLFGANSIFHKISVAVDDRSWCERELRELDKAIVDAKSEGDVITQMWLNRARELIISNHNEWESQRRTTTTAAMSSESSTTRSPRSPSVDGEDPVVYFYQSECGRSVFLHPINFRCLLSQYSSPTSMPTTITATVLECESATITNEIRKRHKFLAHLPLNSEFILCEVDLSAILDAETQEKFRTELKSRHRKRVQLQEEEREQMRLEQQRHEAEVEARRMAAESTMFVDHLDEFFPSLLDAAPSLSSVPVSDFEEDFVIPPDTSPPQFTGPSFSQIVASQAPINLNNSRSQKKKNRKGQVVLMSNSFAGMGMGS